MSYPLLISAAGILVCLLTTFIATDLRPARMVSEIETTLKYQLIISTLLATPVRVSAHLTTYPAPAPSHGSLRLHQGRACGAAPGRRKRFPRFSLHGAWGARTSIGLSRTQSLPRLRECGVPGGEAQNAEYVFPCLCLRAQVVFLISWAALPAEFTGIFTDDPDRVVKNWYMFFCVGVGLWGGLIIGIVTEYFTSNRYRPVQVGQAALRMHSRLCSKQPCRLGSWSAGLLACMRTSSGSCHRA